MGLYRHETEGQRATCRTCGGTGKVETKSYKGQCAKCDGAGEVVYTDVTAHETAPATHDHDQIGETLTVAHQGLQFPLNDLRGLYGKVDPMTLIVVEGIHRKLVEAERELTRLVAAWEAAGDMANFDYSRQREIDKATH